MSSGAEKQEMDYKAAIIRLLEHAGKGDLMKRIFLYVNSLIINN